ncbi:DUF1254 domain-containing protein [Alkalicaulis satelles]|nr:DUF1254 domain-containing protein [Alkalicaulis satelles]
MRYLGPVLVTLIVLAGAAAAGWVVLTRNPDGLSLRDLGQTAGEAYVFGYPLVLMEETRAVMLARLEAEGAVGPGAGGINTLHHRRDLPGAEDDSVVRPNLDTLYTIAWLDLSMGPAVLRWPDMGDRYWLLQVLDGWTDVAGSPGSRTAGSGPGLAFITGPGWDGPGLPGAVHVRSSTSMAWLIGRIEVAPGEDFAPVHALQDAISLTAAPPSGAVRPGDAGQRPPDTVEALAAYDYFTRLAALMAQNPARAQDAEMTARLAALGVDPQTGALDWRGHGLLARRVMGRGVAVARARLAEADRQPPGPQGWRTLTQGLGEYGTNYALRAGVAHIGLGANLAADAIYPNTTRDSAGRPLTGDHVYTLRFEPGAWPPADAFWSVTLYDAHGFLPHGVDGRHALGDRDGLAADADGGLTLWIAPERPADAPDSNWLPAPAGAPFALTARLYAPREAALSGAWIMPGVERGPASR